jgi:hypothetical protein
LSAAAAAFVSTASSSASEQAASAPALSIRAAAPAIQRLDFIRMVSVAPR